MMMLQSILLAIVFTAAAGQRITTIQLDGVQYFISRMNPYSPELNYYLAYQYCRSIGLQLASFETKEKADSITQYLSNAGYNKYDFWTSGNKLGTDMLIWMSTGLPFNATFDYMRKEPGEDMPVARQLGAVEQRKDSGAANGCVALKAPDLQWSTDDCTNIKDFICEQTRCYYYNYGSIPVSTAQGSRSIGRSSSSSSFFTSSYPTSTFTTTTSEPSTSRATESIHNASETVTLDNTTEDLTDNLASTESVSIPPRVHSRNKPHDKSMKDAQENIPWTWARNIELEKPVLKKPANL